VADGELHLTALVLLAPHLTDENHRELLALAKHRTKREVLRLVRTLAPAPSIPDRVEPLGPDPVGITVSHPPTWRNLVESLAAGVRELPPGDRPKDWGDPSAAPAVGNRDGAVPELAADEQPNGIVGVSPNGQPLASLERYWVQFTVSEEYADLLERAQDLLSHAVPNLSLEEVHLRALRLLVEQLEKRKYGAPGPKPSAHRSTAESAQTHPRPPPSKKRARVPRRSGTAAEGRPLERSPP
jgi:hypothetical protein